MIEMKQQKRLVNEKATIQLVREQLAFLSENFWLLKEDSVQIVEDRISLMDYLPYTKSVIHVNTQASFDSSSRVIQAMQQQEAELAYQRKKVQKGIQRMKLLLCAIQALPQKEADCIQYRYVERISYEEIARELGISQSSVGRSIRQGCLHLALLLHLEVYREGEERGCQPIREAVV